MLLLAALALCLSACGGRKSRIQGDWILADTYQSSRQGIQIADHGLAASINQTHKQYTSWKRQGATLILGGKLFGEQDIVDFSDTLRIARLTSTELWTTRESELTKYRRR